MGKSSARLAVMLAGVVLLFTGCTPLARARTLPPSVRSVYVPMIVNRTAEPGIEERFTVAMQEELLADGRLMLVKEKDADAIVRVTLLQYEEEAETFDEDDFPTRRTITVDAHMIVEENIPGRPPIGVVRKIKAKTGYNADPRTTTFVGEPSVREGLASTFGRVAVQELITGEFDTGDEHSAGTRNSSQQRRNAPFKLQR